MYMQFPILILCPLIFYQNGETWKLDFCILYGFVFYLVGKAAVLAVPLKAVMIHHV